MSIAKAARAHKRQLGQFLTPPALAVQLVATFDLIAHDRVLEPSMGDGAFILPLIERFMALYDGPVATRLAHVLQHNVYGVELDETLYAQCLENIRCRWGELPAQHNLVQGDFFRCHFAATNGGFGALTFTCIVGNPPFGGTLAPALQDDLDRVYGFRNGEKIKKETYAFFIVKSLDLLANGGRLRFICSDTFLTINTMRGLRRYLMQQGEVTLRTLDEFSDETNHPMVVLDFAKTGAAVSITVDGVRTPRQQIELTANFSWRMAADLARYFAGPRLGDFMIASSGMTVGKNAYFVREIENGVVREPYSFEFFDDPITLEKEVGRARLGKLSARQVEKIRRLEAAGATRRNVRVVARAQPLTLTIPHPNYCYYNKGVSEIVYALPTHVIYWKDDGDAVLTFKKNGNWYLHGVGGQPYFKREGLTWQLIAQRLYMRYLPPGYILDSGAPCAFLRPGVAHDELYFILGWTLTRLCNRLLKEVINHTKNIQSKDFERLPYPWWVAAPDREVAIERVRQLIIAAQQGERFTPESWEIAALESRYSFSGAAPVAVEAPVTMVQNELFAR
jgi:hypothetical protein